MIGPIDSNDMSDARLVAYIDGELSPEERAAIDRVLGMRPELRERLALLDSGGRPFAEAFDLLLRAAPDDRLQAMFASLSDAGPAVRDAIPDDNVVQFPRRPARAISPIWQAAVAASLALTVFGGGIVTGVLLAPRTPIEQQADKRNWVDAVADYVSLFTRDTLAGMPTEVAAQETGLGRVSAALGKDITPDKVAGLPQLAFKGTQLLQFDGRPIAQIAFLSDTGRPVAICIIRTPKPAEAPTALRREGLNIVHWIAGGYGYMVIGDVPADALTRISDAARARLS
jgi:anti-sigma factor RsiW